MSYSAAYVLTWRHTDRRKNHAGVQLQGVLDEVFVYRGPLGTELGPDGVSVHLWAPTAIQVSTKKLLDFLVPSKWVKCDYKFSSNYIII
jgi:hypothetical protein